MTKQNSVELYQPLPAAPIQAKNDARAVRAPQYNNLHPAILRLFSTAGPTGCPEDAIRQTGSYLETHK